MKTIRKQFLFTLALFLIYYAVSTIVYYIYGDPGIRISDAVYMTGISFTTIGYGDSGFATTDVQKIIFTPLLIWGFLIQIIFVASAVNAFVALKIHIRIEEALMKMLARFKKQHIVIFGVGKIAPHVIEELISVDADFIVADRDPKQIEELREKYHKIHILQIAGKTPTEAELTAVNIAKAKAAIFDLGSDELNHITGDMVQRANGQIKILSVNDQLDFLPIMERDGKIAVNRHSLCAMRIASMAHRPAVFNFLDKMLYKKDGVFRIEEVAIAESSGLIGKSLQEAFETTQLQLLVVGIQDRDVFDIIPRGKQIVQENFTLFVQGELNQIAAFRKLADGELALSDFPRT